VKARFRSAYTFRTTSIAVSSIGPAPHDFDRRIVDRTRTASHLLVDGSDPTILGVANQLRAMPFGFDASTTDAAAQVIEVRPYYNPERRTPVNIVPGLMGVILTMTMILFTAVAIVRERERGNLELLINTPVSSAELMIGKVVPYILIGMLQLALILAVGRMLFDVPVRGSILDLYLAAFAFIAANLALGLFISTAARTQFQAMQMTVFILLPSILLSGFMFPSRSGWAKSCRTLTSSDLRAASCSARPPSASSTGR
jgi:ABC-2 type transport system permease protein